MHKSYKKLRAYTSNNNESPILESPNNLPPHPLSQTTKSKAYTSAMIALQNRIRQLEYDNKNLSEESKGTREELGKNKKMVEDIAFIENNLRIELEKAHNEHYKIKEENNQLAETMKILEDQVKQLMIEKNKHLEQNAADKNQWKIEREQLLSSIKENEDKVKELTRSKEIMINEVEELRSSLNHAKDLYQKPFKEAEKELKKLKEENKKTNEKLNKSNSELLPLKAKLKAVTNELDRVKANSKSVITHNKRNITTLKKTIEQQKKEIDALKNYQCKYAQPSKCSAQTISQSSVLKDLTLRERSQRNNAKMLNSYKNFTRNIANKFELTTNSENKEMKMNSLTTPNRKDTMHKTMDQKILNQASSITLLKSTQMDENNSLLNVKRCEEYKIDEVLNEIFLLEREIAYLSYQCKDLCTKSHNSITASETLQKLSKELREKKERLARLNEEELVM